MSEHIPLTEKVHALVSETAGPGDQVVDATAGNGHDCLMLARLVGNEGRVYAFDIQEKAIRNTRQRLVDEGMLEPVTLFEAGHERMKERLPSGSCGRIAAVLFNLGYLPGADKGLSTGPITTIPALRHALDCLRTGGLLSVIAYRGHQGGQDEYETVKSWFLQQSPLFHVNVLDPGHRLAPVLFTLSKLNRQARNTPISPI